MFLKKIFGSFAILSDLQEANFNLSRILGPTFILSLSTIAFCLISILRLPIYIKEIKIQY